jgi:hypothetical protein
MRGAFCQVEYEREAKMSHPVDEGCAQGGSQVADESCGVQVEYEREAEMLRAEGGADAVAAAVAVAVSGLQGQLAGLQRRCADLEARLVRALPSSAPP